MKFNVTASGHDAEVTITPDGKGNFSGSITHTEFGDGQITGTENNSSLSGSVNLDGHNAKFNATVSGQHISGVITPTGWLSLLGPASFSGTLAA